MTDQIVTRGLQVYVGRASNTADSFAAVQTMAVDDGSTGFVAGDTTLNSPGNVLDVPFDSTPTRSGQTVSYVATLSTSQFNSNTIRRISLHNDSTGNVTGASATLVAGVDGQTIAKTSSFSLTFTLDVTFTAS